MTEFNWTERYRPATTKDCILPSAIRKTVDGFIASKSVPNLLMSGNPGMGKTSLAFALLRELDFEYTKINGSLNGNIDTLRNDIAQYASSVSFNGRRKFVIIDEADYLNTQSTMPALRGFIEEFSNTGFILTCNYQNRIIDPIRSRFSLIEFQVPKEERRDMMSEYLKKLISILKAENVKYDPQAILSVVKETFPDLRRAIMELQKYSQTGYIDAGIVSSLKNLDISNLINLLKAKKFNDMRTWVFDHQDVDFAALSTSLYDTMPDLLRKESVPQLVLLLSQYDYKNSFAANRQINTLACLTEIMAQVEFQ